MASAPRPPGEWRESSARRGPGAAEDARRGAQPSRARIRVAPRHSTVGLTQINAANSGARFASRRSKRRWRASLDLQCDGSKIFASWTWRVWRIDHEWEEREEGEDEICRLHIDGAALTVRREATGLV